MANKVKNREELNRFNPDFNVGLNDEQLLYMRENGCINKNKNPTNKSYFRIVIGNVFTFFNILMFVIAALLFAVVGRKVVTNLMFLLIILFNIIVGTIQECKSKHTIEKLKLLSDSKITVRRNGEELKIASNEIVLDDIIILSAGDQICADCIIEEDVVLEVNEALLTGESVPVKKGKGEPLFAGSFVVSGYGAVRADKVGNDTYISSIENKAKLAKQPKSHLMLAIASIIRTMAFIAIPLAIVVFIEEFIRDINANPNLPIGPTYWGEESAITNAMFFSGTTIAYMIPAGMTLLASIAMATGVIKLGQENTLAQNLYSVESLSRVNTLCLDKTGTLTDGTMSVENFILIDKKMKEEELEKLIASYLSAFKSTNQTSIAMINRFGEERTHEISDSVQFSSARKYSAVKFKELGWFALGAPEYLTKDKEILNQVNEFAASGLRVVLLARVNGEMGEDKPLPEKKENIAMFIIRDTIRPEVPDTMKWFRENDVDIKVISGDNIGTVSYIAKQSGIENWDKVVDVSKLTPEDNFEEIVMNNSIFGRVNPDQKADIIAILKKNGRITGVTGDGLNDLLAFKQADCSIALANGAAATKNVANLILLDSNFANMKEAVFQGRRVVNNIQRSSSLFVMKDILWMLITVLPILIGVQHIFQPTVMTLVNLFITGLASLFISLEPDKTRVTGDFYRNVTNRAVSAGIFMFFPVLFIMMFVITNQIIELHHVDLTLMYTVFKDGEIVSLGWIPVAAICVTIAGFIIFFENCKPFTKFRKILFGVTLGIVLFVLYLIPEYFIVSGTDMLKETGGVLNMFSYIFSHMGANATFALYRTLELPQVIFLGIYLVVAYPLFRLSKKLNIFFDKWLYRHKDTRKTADEEIRNNE